MSWFSGSSIEKLKEGATIVEDAPMKATPAVVRVPVEDVRKLCSEITIMIPYRPNEGINAQVTEYMISWVNAGMRVVTVKDSFGGFIEMLRNYMAYMFLREHKDKRFLMMLDNDVIPFSNDAPLLLARHGLPVVSGVACGFRPDIGLFACIAVKDKAGVARFPDMRHTKVMPARGTKELKACGTGIIMIRRDVLETIVTKEDPFSIPEHVRLESSRIGTMRKTEDICFSDRVTKSGFKIYADFEVHAWHDKKIPIHWDQSCIDPNLDAADWDVTDAAFSAETD